VHATLQRHETTPRVVLSTASQGPAQSPASASTGRQGGPHGTLSGQKTALSRIFFHWGNQPLRGPSRHPRAGVPRPTT
jgi:hypothetical protein